MLETRSGPNQVLELVELIDRWRRGETEIEDVIRASSWWASARYQHAVSRERMSTPRRLSLLADLAEVPEERALLAQLATEITFT